MINLYSDRLWIRDHVGMDLKAMHELLSSTKAMRYLPEIKTRSIDESRENLRVALNEAISPSRGKFFLAIIERETQTYVGEIGLAATETSEIGNIFNLGYFIKESFWGKGYVTEAAKVLIEYAFNQLNAHKIETGCLKENTASERVMIKLEMIREAELKEHVLFEGAYRDRVEYRLLKSEFEILKGSNHW